MAATSDVWVRMRGAELDEAVIDRLYPLISRPAGRTAWRACRSVGLHLQWNLGMNERLTELAWGLEQR